MRPAHGSRVTLMLVFATLLLYLPMPLLATEGPVQPGELDRYHFDLPSTPQGYAIVPKHFVDEVDPREPPMKSEGTVELSTFSAKGEWRTVGFVIYATADLESLTIESSDLKSDDGAKIPTENVALFLNRRAMVRRAPRVPDDDRIPTAALLDPASPFDLPKGRFKEVSVTLHVPPETPAGDYRSMMAITAQDKPAVQLPLSVRVLPFRLQPSPRKEFGVYYLMDLDGDARPQLRADLRDIRDHHATHIFSWRGMEHRKKDDQVNRSG